MSTEQNRTKTGFPTVAEKMSPIFQTKRPYCHPALHALPIQMSTVYSVCRWEVL